MTREDNEEEFITKTKHRKRHAKQEEKTDETAGDGSGISLRPRNMFAMKGRGRTESESAAGSPYRPQWSKDGEGFVSASKEGSAETPVDTASRDAVGRRKSKVLRYTRDELLALHVQTKSPPVFPPETVVASEHCLPPVGTLPFDYEEIYKQWAMNRNRGRGRGRGTNATGQPMDRTNRQDSGKWEENRWDRTSKRDQPSGDGDRWERGARVNDDETFGGDDIWDDVGKDGSLHGELDLSSMAEAAEKFRLEMDALRKQIAEPEEDKVEVKGDLDAFDKRLEDAAKSGQFEDSDEEVEWDIPDNSNKDGDKEAIPTSEISSAEPRQNSLPPGLENPPASVPPQPEVVIKDEWFYLDPQGVQQGPFKTAEMREWFEAGYFKPHLPIRFGRTGGFAALATHFVQGQMPFADVQRILMEQQRKLQQQQQEESQRQAQQMFHLQQQQERERMMRISHEETMRLEMQRMEAARHHHQNQMFQQHVMHHQQHQHMLLQQQTSWQRNQREGILSALGIFGGGGQGGQPIAPDNFPANGQNQFPGLVNGQQQQPQQQQHPLHAGPGMMHERPFLDQPQAQPVPWPNGGNVRPFGDMQDGQSATFDQTRAGVAAMPQQNDSAPAQVKKDPESQPHVDSTPSAPVLTISNEDSEKMSSNDSVSKESVTPRERKPKEKEHASVSPKKKRSSATTPTETAWEDSSASAGGKSLREIQEEEQREMRRKMEANAQSEPANLAQMGAQLKMMLGVQSMQMAQPTPSAANATTPNKSQSKPATATTSGSSASPWNTAKINLGSQQPAKSMRDILAEEERLAQERAKRNETPSNTSHWMNVVAGTANAPPAKPTRSLGPVPASVLKSSKQLRSNADGSRSSGTTPNKTDADASFWNFGAAQSTKPDGTNGSSFGSKPVPNELMSWCAKQLESLGGVENMALMEYCSTLEDPGEIREYIAAYLGSTPRVSAFATEFIQKKKQVGNMRRPSGPNSESSSVGASTDPTQAKAADSTAKKGKRRGKGQKVDASMLSYSVGS